MKASAVDRALSLKRLAEKLGPYIPAQGLEKVVEQSRYHHVSLHRSPERGALYAEYQQGIEKRKTGLAAVKEQEDAALAAIKGKWVAKRRELERLNIAKKNRRNLLQLARKHEAAETVRARLSFQSPREAIRGEIPFASWNGFLQHKANQGNETALAILRSKQETMEPELESQPAVGKDWSQYGKEQFAANRSQVQAEYAGREVAALKNENASGQGKKQLLAILRMERLAAEDAAHIQGFSATVDRKGTVIFNYKFVAGYFWLVSAWKVSSDSRTAIAAWGTAFSLPLNLASSPSQTRKTIEMIFRQAASNSPCSRSICSFIPKLLGELSPCRKEAIAYEKAACIKTRRLLTPQARNSHSIS